ncbi:MAG TPA: asparagine synthetase B family protein, partial [Saprospiraceae bacterium]|nr:asparagine synthetase B family protein [Saprospiraceae bacterium]
MNPELNTICLSEFLTYQAAMGTHTMIKGIQRLPAGSYAIIKQGHIEERTYWSFEGIQPPPDKGNPASRIQDLFMSAVQLCMVSDVPVGAFLSGGIDSSLIVSCMARLTDQPVNTFTISFDETGYDESSFAQQVATRYHTNHHRILIRPEAFLDSLDEILGAMDTPSGDGPNTYLVSKYTRKEGIKVALSGLGGDELFAGYNKFLIYYQLMRRKWVMSIPAILRHGIGKTISSFGMGHRFNKLINLLDLPKWDLSTVYPILRRSYSDDEIKAILKTPSTEDAVAGRLEKIQAKIQWMGEFSQCTIGEMETYTRDVLLRDTDQMSMAHALEVRVPFFNHQLIEYVLSLPDDIKFPHTPK